MHTRSLPFLFVVGLLSACSARQAEPAPADTTPPPAGDALPDGGDAAPPVDAGTLPAAVPLTALVEILQLTPAAGQLSVSANAGFVDVAVQSLSAQAGDRLRIRGQVEWTNDFALPVAGASELVVDGKVVAPVTYQNNVQLGTHHTVLYQSASVAIATDGAHRVALRFSAGESAASPTVTVEASQYTQLVIEHYRTFPSVAAATAAGAYLLRGIAESHATTVTTYGATPSALEKIYEVTTPALKGDLVRLSAQTTSAWNAGNPQLFEMHGTAIHVDGKTQQQLSAFASENTPYDVNVTPLWTDGSYRVPADGKYQFDVTMHGVFGVGGLVEGAEGHLAALVFSPAASLALALSETTTAKKDVSSTANAPRLTVVSRELDVAAGAIARLEGTLELSLGAGAQLNPACEGRLTLRDPTGAIVRTGSALKYLTSSLGAIALRTELVVAPATAGTYKVELSAGCTRSGENTPFVVSGAGARILTDLFLPTP